ncbi:MAG: HIT family protein [Palaeococcus sp.]|uniref:HIT family protein n=1 Tax=Palaeococcus sp. (in: euryarchaeotes) TaxID=2820298 RepID=UPI0025EAE006|nr:HIT family protein [Palaeococcus sp. (in: euryarchaeotes)]MCD6559642.1 HIT family protein [Palaeococcus sp. (in: euryarchaeotes)]
MECPFCNPPREALLYEDGLIKILIDSYPAGRGHLLVVPKKHAKEWNELTWEEKMAIFEGMELAMENLKKAFNPDGFNIGINLGRAAGQTVEHIHLHVIPRYEGDSKFPRGGVRKAVLDIEDENLSLKERWIKNRMSEEEIKKLKEVFELE